MKLGVLPFFITFLSSHLYLVCEYGQACQLPMFAGRLFERDTWKRTLKLSVWTRDNDGRRQGRHVSRAAQLVGRQANSNIDRYDSGTSTSYHPLSFPWSYKRQLPEPFIYTEVLLRCKQRGMWFSPAFQYLPPSCVFSRDRDLTVYKSRQI